MIIGDLHPILDTNLQIQGVSTKPEKNQDEKLDEPIHKIVNDVMETAVLDTNGEFKYVKKYTGKEKTLKNLITISPSIEVSYHLMLVQTHATSVYRVDKKKLEETLSFTFKREVLDKFSIQFNTEGTIQLSFNFPDTKIPYLSNFLKESKINFISPQFNSKTYKLIPFAISLDLPPIDLLDIFGWKDGFEIEKDIFVKGQIKLKIKCDLFFTPNFKYIFSKNSHKALNLLKANFGELTFVNAGWAALSIAGGILGTAAILFILVYSVEYSKKLGRTRSLNTNIRHGYSWRVVHELLGTSVEPTIRTIMINQNEAGMIKPWEQGWEFAESVFNQSSSEKEILRQKILKKYGNDPHLLFSYIFTAIGGVIDNSLNLPKSPFGIFGFKKE